MATEAEERRGASNVLLQIQKTLAEGPGGESKRRKAPSWRKGEIFFTLKERVKRRKLLHGEPGKSYQRKQIVKKPLFPSRPGG